MSDSMGCHQYSDNSSRIKLKCPSWLRILGRRIVIICICNLYICIEFYISFFFPLLRIRSEFREKNESITFFSKKISPGVWAEVSRKCIFFSSRSKLHEFEQHSYATSYRNFYSRLKFQIKFQTCLKPDSKNTFRLNQLDNGFLCYRCQPQNQDIRAHWRWFIPFSFKINADVLSNT